MSKFYSIKKILNEKADYNMIIGERSNGKTYSTLEKIITDYVKEKKEGAYIRRWKEDLVGKRADTVFKSLVENNVIKKLTKDEWTNVIYSRGAWHLAKYDESEKRMKAEKNPFCYAFSLSDVEHDKSLSYPNVKNIVFDEFLTRRYYLPDEFIIFMNVLSTIIRQKDDVTIFMLGNTVNKYCPYFEEMGLKNIESMEQGVIDVYSFGNEGNLKIAVEYCSEINKNKKSNKYFAFDNPRLNMITKGHWELAIYPHLPMGYKINSFDIIFSFHIIFSGKKVTCDVITKNSDTFIFIHKKTTDVKKNELVYTLDYTPSLYTRKSFLTPIDKADIKIKQFFSSNRVFYQSNEVGEIVHNYMLACIKI